MVSNKHGFVRVRMTRKISSVIDRIPCVCMCMCVFSNDDADDVNSYDG